MRLGRALAAGFAEERPERTTRDTRRDVPAAAGRPRPEEAPERPEETPAGAPAEVPAGR